MPFEPAARGEPRSAGSAQTPSITRRAPHAYCHLPLWSGSGRRASQTAQPDQLQLLCLPPLRHPVVPTTRARRSASPASPAQPARIPGETSRCGSSGVEPAAASPTGSEFIRRKKAEWASTREILNPVRSGLSAFVCSTVPPHGGMSTEDRRARRAPNEAIEGCAAREEERSARGRRGQPEPVAQSEAWPPARRPARYLLTFTTTRP